MKSSEASCDSTLFNIMKAEDCNKYFNSYGKDFRSLFNGEVYKKTLCSVGIKGLLANSKFRSICWKVYLGCLPEDQQMWIDEAKSQRQRYDEIFDKFHTNPRCGIKNADVTVNNPLTQAQNSPWYQYFQDTELKLTIEQDVVRTFPEIEFFQSSKIQEMMINILFLYAREFPGISYKQGMHELLAPIIYVLHHDQQAYYLHASETDKLELSMHILLNQNYIEHDAFSLFCQLMDAVEDWYTLNECATNRQIGDEPFLNESFSGSNNKLGIKLKKIHHNYLKKHDLELFTYLEQMEISPQIYGIRWLRLLFGREFAIHDLLLIWDAIFADSIIFDLVDYVFVAMLICIRDLLINGDYASSLSYLMRYPHVADVRYIIDLALYLRNPDSCSNPSNRSTQVAKPLPVRAAKESKQSVYKTFSKNFFPGQAKLVKQGSFSKPADNRPNTLKIIQADNFPSNDVSVLQSSSVSETVSDLHVRSASLSSKKSSNSPSPEMRPKSGSLRFDDMDKNYPLLSSKEHFYTLPRTMIRNVMENKEHKFKAADLSHSLSNLMDTKSPGTVTLYKEMVPLVKKFPLENGEIPKELTGTASLKAELFGLRAMNEYCVQQMSLHIEKLQDTMVCQNLQFEDEMLIALAGIKRARDILKGTVSFTKEVIGDDINPYGHISKSCSDLAKEVLAPEETHSEALRDYVFVEGNSCDSVSITKVDS